MDHMAAPRIPQADIESFASHLRKASRVLVLCGAGLSAASGLPTFRGAGGIWRSHDATSLATPEAFAANPGLVWQFYSYRRHMALQAKPNPAHYALAKLSERKSGVQTLTQNVDGLSPRAGHPLSTLHPLHGSLFDIKCSSLNCSYFETENYTDPIVPSLAIPRGVSAPAPLGTAASGEQATASLETAMRGAQSGSQELDIADDRVEIANLNPQDLPQCPQCRQALLRPGVVWFGEALPEKTMKDVDDFIDAADTIDLIIVIGTSGQVYPAAGYVEIARQKGAKVAVVNMDADDLPGKGRERKPVEWFFQGDAGALVPRLFEAEIGPLSSSVND